jgi:hypothetical protein
MVVGFWRENYSVKVLLSLKKTSRDQVQPSTVEADCDHLAEVMFVRFFFYDKVTLSSLPTVYSLEESYYVPLTLKVRSHAPSP